MTIAAASRPCRWLHTERLLFTDPFAGFVIKRSAPPLQPVPTEEEVIKILSAINGVSPRDLRDRALLEVAYATALRCGELHALEVKSLDLANLRVRVVSGKGGKDRVVPLTGCAAEAVEKYLKSGRKQLIGEEVDCGALWICSKFAGRVMSYHSIGRVFERRASMVGLEASPHAFRRACATHLLLHGMPPAMLKELLGHAGYNSLDFYLRYAPTDLMAAHANTSVGQ